MNPILQQLLGGLQVGAGLMTGNPRAFSGGINNFRHGGLMRNVNNNMPGSLPINSGVSGMPNPTGNSMDPRFAAPGFTMPSSPRSQYNHDMVTE